jgi:hypothetical protein
MIDGLYNIKLNNLVLTFFETKSDQAWYLTALLSIGYQLYNNCSSGIGHIIMYLHETHHRDGPQR